MDDLRLMGRAVEVDGPVEGNLTAAGTAVTLRPGTVVDGDALLAGENVVVQGEVGGDVRVYASTVTLNGGFDGDVRVAAEDIVVMPGTRIDGDLVYTTTKDLFLDPKVALGGQLVRKDVEAPELGVSPPSWRRSAGLNVFFYVCALLVAVPFIALFPHYTGRAVRLVRQSVLKCALAGLVGLCLVPMAAVFALVTVVGMPLGILLLLAYTILLYLSKIVVALALGGMLLRRRGPQAFGRALTALSLGLLIIYALSAIPAAWFAVWFVVVLLGFGALLLAMPSSLAPEAALPPSASPPPVPPPQPPLTPGSSP